MRTSLKALTVAATLIFGIAATPALYAQSSERMADSTTSPMMQGKMPKGQGAMPMGQGNMSMGMMTMMVNMMETHIKMMKTMMAEQVKTQPDKKQ